MINGKNKSKIIKRLEQLQSKVGIKEALPIILDLEKWFNSDDQCASFGEYALKVKEKNPNATIIVDDMIIQTDMNVDSWLILNYERETIEFFVNLAMQEDEVQYMKEYIKLFRLWVDVDDLEPEEETIKKLNYIHDKSLFRDGRYWTVEEQIEQYLRFELERHEMELQVTREIISEWSNPFYLDFFDHYKVLSVEELVERYKDSRYLEGEDHGKVYSRFKKHEQ